MFQYERMVVENLDVEVLAGTPFMEANDIAVRPAKRLITLAGGSFFTYGSSWWSFYTASCASRHGSSRSRNFNHFMARRLYRTRTPQCFPPDSLHALEPRSVIPQVHLVNTSELWPPPGIISSVAGRIWIPNLSGEPIQLKRHEHFCLVAPSSPLVLMSCLNALPTSLSNQSTFRLLHLVPASHQLSALIQKISYSPIILLPPKWLWLCFRPHNPRL